jgi:VanZ family protein
VNGFGVGRTPEPATTSAPPRQRRRILFISLALWSGCFLYLTLAPHVPRIGSVDSNDFAAWGHFVGTMGVAVILYLLVVDSQRVSRRTAALGTIVAASAFGVVIEILQGLTATRDPSISDAIVDALGAAIAVGLVALVPSWVRPLTRLTVASTGVFTAATIVAAVFFTPGAGARWQSDHDCPATNISHHAPAPSPPSTGGSRTRGGLIAVYVPRARTGSTVINGSDPGHLDLHLVEPGVERVEHGIRFSGGAARTDGPATSLIDTVVRHKALTIEAWVRSDDLSQNGPTRIVTISDGTERGQVDVHLGEEKGALSIRLRANCGEYNSTLVDGVFDSSKRFEHVALTFADGMQRIYVQGRLVDATRFEGDLSGWNRHYPLVVGNEATRDRPFLGDVALVAIFDRALPASKVAANAASGLP